jgi:hypothetical protein
MLLYSIYIIKITVQDWLVTEIEGYIIELKNSKAQKRHILYIGVPKFCLDLVLKYHSPLKQDRKIGLK